MLLVLQEGGPKNITNTLSRKLSIHFSLSLLRTHTHTIMRTYSFPYHSSYHSNPISPFIMQLKMRLGAQYTRIYKPMKYISLSFLILNCNISHCHTHLSISSSISVSVQHFSLIDEGLRMYDFGYPNEKN